MTKLETLTLSSFYPLGVVNHPRTLRCKGFGVFRSCAILWDRVLFWHPRKSLWKCPISKGLRDRLVTITN
ncbi:MAG: hypothetical protein ACKPBB_20930 [Sphaerospermopsis kisseleviana]